MALDLENHGLAGQVRVVVLGESDVNVLFVAGLHTDDLLLKAGDKAVGTQLQAVVLPLAAVKGFAVQVAVEVDNGSVTLLGLPLHGHQTGVPVAELLQTLVHIGGRDLYLFLFRGQTLVLAQGDLGIHGDNGLEGKAVARGIAHQLHRRVTHHLKLLLLHGLLIGIGERNIDGLLVKDLRAIHPLNELAGGLAGTEARHIDLSAHLPIRLFDGGLKRLRTDLDGQSDLAFFDLFTAFHTHVVYSSVHRRLHAGASIYSTRRILKLPALFQLIFHYSQIFFGANPR